MTLHPQHRRHGDQSTLPIDFSTQAERESSAWASNRVFRGDALESYGEWPSPATIISDGAYGVGGFLTIRIQGEIDEHERWNGLNALDLWERYS